MGTIMAETVNMLSMEMASTGMIPEMLKFYQGAIRR